MPKKRYTADEIIHELRKAEVLLSQGKTVPSRARPETGNLFWRDSRIVGGCPFTSRFAELASRPLSTHVQ